MSDFERVVINLPSSSIGGFGPNYPSSVVMVFPNKPFRRRRKIKKIFDFTK